MSTNVLKYGVIAIVAAVIGVAGYIVIKTTPSPTVEAKIPIRGLVVHAHHHLEDQAFIGKIRNMGANWVEIVLWVLVTENGELIPYIYSVPEPPFSIDEIRSQAPMTEQRIASRIKQAHDLGFKVFLCTYHERLGRHHDYGVEMRIDVENFLEEAKKIAVRWAEIAEKNGVEMFAPRKELQMFIGLKKALEWDDEILPALRSVYHGDLVRGAFQIYHWGRGDRCAYQYEELPSNLGEWDYLGVDFYGNYTDTFEDLAAMYARFVSKVEELKTQNNLKGVVFQELGVPHHGTESYWNDKSLSGDEIMNRFYQIFFEGGADVIEGFFPWEWEKADYDLPAGRHEHIAPEDVIKKYYTASTIIPYSGPIADVYVPRDISYEVTRTLLQDNFDDDSNWKNLSENAIVKDGVLEFRGNGGAELKDASTEKWRNYTLSGKFMITEGTNLTFRVRSTGSWQLGHNYQFTLEPISRISLVRSGLDGLMWVRETELLIEYRSVQIKKALKV